MHDTNDGHEEELFSYLSPKERELRCSLLADKFHTLEVRYNYVIQYGEDITARVSCILEGEELLFYQKWTELRNETGKSSCTTGPFLEQGTWFSHAEIPKMHRVEYRDWEGLVSHIDFVPQEECDINDYTQEEIESYLRDCEDDEIYNENEWGEYVEKPSFSKEHEARGKSLRLPNQDKKIRETFLILDLLKIKILRRISSIKKHINHLNKYRKVPLPLEYPDYKKLAALADQLLKIEKQLLRLKLRLFSYETQTLIKSILSTNGTIVADIMTKEVIATAVQIKEYEGINGHADPHHKLLGIEQQKKRYKRKNKEMIKQAFEDHISYNLEHGCREIEHDEWLAFSQTDINNHGARTWLNIGRQDSGKENRKKWTPSTE